MNGSIDPKRRRLLLSFKLVGFGVSGRNSMVECQLPKLEVGVRVPSPAPDFLTPHCASFDRAIGQ